MHAGDFAQATTRFLATAGASRHARCIGCGAGKTRAGPIRLVLLLTCAWLSGCDAARDAMVCTVEAAYRAGSSSASPPPDAVTVVADAETEPVADPCDAADDPAVWVNPTAPPASLVVATNKRRGLVVYDLDGRLRSRLDLGQTNNVDLRPRQGGAGAGEFAEAAVAHAVASNRSSDSLDVLHLFADGRLKQQRAIPAGFDGESPYGLCMYRSSTGLYAFATYKDGAIRQWQLGGDGEGDHLVRTLRVASQVEGCVADDQANTIFVGEEDAGIWRFDAEPAGTAAPILVDGMRGDGGQLVADVEGLALYAPQDSPASGYLVASSQGNSTFVIYDRSPPHAYRGSFQVGTARTDKASDTDGIAIASTPLGTGFPDGLLVVQDGDNRGPTGEAEHQNFKLISWRNVTTAVGVP